MESPMAAPVEESPTRTVRSVSLEVLPEVKVLGWDEALSVTEVMEGPLGELGSMVTEKPGEDAGLVLPAASIILAVKL